MQLFNCNLCEASRICISKYQPIYFKTRWFRMRDSRSNVL